MSVIVKGMEMPECCYDCPFIRASLFAGDYYCAKGKGSEDDVNKVYNRRMADCPLVEIPTPHGDLVDRNKLLAEYDRQHMGEAGNARKIMEQAETVIEGSET